MNAPPLMPNAGNSPTAPNYIDLQDKELLKERASHEVPQGSTPNRGAMLTTDTLDVPLEAWGLMYDRSQSSRPTLMPLFRTRYVEGSPSEDKSIGFYEALRNQLPPELKARLEKDERLPFKQRDPDLIALDQSLHFDATLLAIAQALAAPASGSEEVQLRTDQYRALPEAAKQNLLQLASSTLARLEGQLQAMGPNDPSYDLFSGTFNLIKEAIFLLKQTSDKGETPHASAPTKAAGSDQQAAPAA